MCVCWKWCGNEEIFWSSSSGGRVDIFVRSSQGCSITCKVRRVRCDGAYEARPGTLRQSPTDFPRRPFFSSKLYSVTFPCHAMYARSGQPIASLDAPGSVVSSAKPRPRPMLPLVVPVLPKPFCCEITRPTMRAGCEVDYCTQPTCCARRTHFDSLSLP